MKISASTDQIRDLLRHKIGACLYTTSTEHKEPAQAKVGAVAIPTSAGWLHVAVSGSLSVGELTDAGHDGEQGDDHDPHKPLMEQGWKVKPRPKMDPGAIRVTAIE